MSVSIIGTISESNAGIYLLAILLLLLAALLGGRAVSLIRVPKVAGEILGGMVIGPTVLGHFFPEAYTYIFHSFAGEGSAISVFYWLGLIMLMFSSGYESTMEDFSGDKKIIAWLAAGATIIPMLGGFWISRAYFLPHYLGEAGNSFAFNMIFAIGVAVTSLPVISKIFMELGLITHRYAKIILTTATIQDLILWIILSVVSSMVTNRQVTVSTMLAHVGITLLMFFFAACIAPKLSQWNLLQKSLIFSYDSIYFIVCFFCVYAGSLFSVNIMYSAFVAGLIFKHIKHPDAVRAQEKIKDICLSFFTPVYFAIVGLRIHITSDFDIALFLSFLLLASFLELFGCVAAMRGIGLGWLSSFNLGVAMNARGGPGIVLASVTYEMGIINYEFFCVLIFTTLISSAAAGWWIDYINRQGKLLAL